nr:uncharacterized mitochondrial protein AtMg00810-like [Tanacetum cinerariifolium]
MVVASRVPMLKPGEFERRRMRIEQYIQMMDYALWDVIENGNSIPKTQTVNNVETVIPSTTAEEKLQRRNEVKARSTLMMGLPDEHQLKFNSFKDAKSLLEAIEKSNGVNTAQGVNTANEVNTASSQVNDASSLNIDNLSDVVICAFLWQMAMLTMRAERFLENAGRKLNLNGNDSVAFDKTKVECYNCHKRGQFARLCRVPKGRDNRSRDVTRNTMPVETPNSSVLVSCDGLGGYDWSDQAEEGLTDYALMAYSTSSASSSDSEVSDCSKSCLKAVENLKSTNEKLLTDLRKSEIMVVAYKEGLKFVEQRLEFFKTNESEYIEQINVLKIDIHCRDRALTELQRKLDLAETKKQGIQLNVNKLKNASKILNTIIECQIVDNCKKGLGYNVVLPPYTGLFPPLKSDLSYTGKGSDAPIIEDWVSDDKEEKVNTAKPKAAVNAAKAKAKHKAVKGKRGNAVKASACWSSQDNEFQPSNDGTKKVDEDLRKENECNHQGDEDSTNSTNRVNNVTLNINTASSSRVNVVGTNIIIDLPPDPNMHSLEDIGIFEDSHDDEDDHPLEQVIGDLHSAPQTRRMTKNLEEHGLVCTVIPRTNKKDSKISYLLVSYLNWNPRRFEDPDFPDKVYKLEKVLYGLHQAPRAWYETISTYLLDNRFKRGQIDKTLFIKRNKGDILLVQVYVDDIIFGSTKKEMCDAFKILMHENFQMSSMGELTFILGLQVKQKKEGIFINQDKYVAEILKKFRFSDVKKASTPMETSKPLLKDKDGEGVDVHMYRSMIGSLMYLTLSRPDIMFVGQPKSGLWYLKDSPFDLVAYIDSDYAGASLDRKSTTGGCQFLGCRLISWQCKKQIVAANSTTKAEYVAASSCYGQRVGIRFFGAVTYLFGTMMVQALKEVSDLPTDVQDTPIPDEPSSSQSQRKHKPKRKERKETKVSPTEIHTEDHVPATSHDPLPSGEDRMQLTELMELCKNLSNKVLDLENKVIEMKSSHKEKIEKLKSRVKKLEEKNMSLTEELKSFNTMVKSLTIKETVMDKEESSKQGRKIIDIDADAKVNLENVYNLDMAHEETVLSMQDVDVQSERIEDVKEVTEEVVEVMKIAKIIVDEVSTAGGELNAANEKQVSVAPINITTAQPSEATKATVDITTTPKDKGIVFNNKEESITRITSLKSQAKDKGQAKKYQARKNMMIYLKNMVGYKMDYFKGMSYEQIRPIFKMEYSKDNAKKQKLEEQEEAEELKKNLEIVPDDEDDVFMNVTPLSFKPPTIVDYKIYKEGKKENF